MFESLTHEFLQNYWWLLISILGAALVSMFFVQGGQTHLWSLARSEKEKSLVINTLGKKWELGFTTLVTFGGALFAAFPLFYSTSFGGAYFFWMLVLFNFIIQAVSYEFRKRSNNLLGARTYEFFLILNGFLGVFLLGVGVGTMFTGAFFSLNEARSVTWYLASRGLEGVLNPFNVVLGYLLIFVSRIMGAQYFMLEIDDEEFNNKSKISVLTNGIFLVPVLVYFLYLFLTIPGVGLDAAGKLQWIDGKFLKNLNELGVLGWGVLGLGLILFVTSLVGTVFLNMRKSFWLAFSGTFFIALSLFFCLGYNQTSIYPSLVDIESSLTLKTSSSSMYTLKVMSLVSLGIPFILAYISYVWYKMSGKPLKADDLKTEFHVY